MDQPKCINCHEFFCNPATAKLCSKCYKDSVENSNNNSDFSIVILQGNRDELQKHIEKGANINTVYERGWTPLLIALVQGNIDVAKLLLQSGAKVDQARNDGTTPLFIASEKGHIDVAKLLLQSGAYVDQANNNDRSSLWIFSQSGNMNGVKLLLAFGANVNQVDCYGMSPLWISVACGYMEIVKLLLQYKAEVNLPDTRNITVLKIARHEGHKAIENILLQHGATDVSNSNTIPPFYVEYKPYKVLKKLGEGAFGVVSKVVFPGYSDTYVFKELPDTDSSAFRKNQQEYFIQGSLRHKNVTAIHGARIEDKKWYLIMELAEHGSLRDYMEKKQRVFILEFAKDIVNAMVFMYSRTPPVFHRDLKTTNVLIFEGPDRAIAKVSDFGLARTAHFGENEWMTYGMGYVPILAPERFCVDPQTKKRFLFTEKCDVFSFGIILWEMITKGDMSSAVFRRPASTLQPIFELSPDVEQVHPIQKRLLENVASGARPNVPLYCLSDYAKMIEDCWAHNPDDRPTFRQIQERLNQMKEFQEKIITFSELINVDTKGYALSTDSDKN